MNLLPNSRSTPETPYEMKQNKKPTMHYKHPFLPFGSTAMVLTGAAKRQQAAKERKLPSNTSPLAELGVNLGQDVEDHI